MTGINAFNTITYELRTNRPPAFGACAMGRTVTMVWACRPQKLAMNSCMIQYQGQEEMDKARAEWFRLAGERTKAREEMERRTEEARRKHKEWWALDESGKLQGRKAEVDGAEKR
jgi:COX assembly mitochondrial protein 1